MNVTAAAVVTGRPDPAVGLAEVRAELAAACVRAQRSPASVTLVAASKTVTAEGLEPAIAAGQSVYGENRVQEAQGKWPALRERHPQTELHLIGPLQTNKARDAVALFDVIHSVDRIELCRAIARRSAELGRRPRLFIQVNTGSEVQKAGVLPQELDALLEVCRGEYDLDVTGLMCIPPVDEPAGRHFALLAEAARRNGLDSLSMGMSSDYAEAIEHGATHVRVGSAIFGSRA
ncbi:YggS family pyridoxal phosphate-dependent enzyme [Kitasatospora sp. NPDC096147]|uniref:YggS family pyridoxal phosphate-dependent enzyme n=1 Tax=Kitasatospora sp. NPDC096147 TaxID=3364093 RepID=UPI00381F81D2